MLQTILKTVKTYSRINDLEVDKTHNIWHVNIIIWSYFNFLSDNNVNLEDFYVDLSDNYVNSLDL